MENYGIISTIPAIIVIVLALKTKKILLSLMIGGYIGAIILSGWNPLTALPIMVQDYVFPAVTDNVGTIVLITIAGGFVSLIKNSGASQALGDFASRHIHTKKGAETATFAAVFGLLYMEPGFTLGVIMRPVTERFRVARVKLAYLCDALASPIASMSPICAYGPVITSLIAAQMALLSMGDNPWPIYLKYLPFNFYAILSILTVFIVVRTGIDVGPMYVAESRATLTGELVGPNDKPIIHENEGGFKLPEGAKITLNNILIPLIVVFVTLFGVVFWAGDVVHNGIVGALTSGKVNLGIICAFSTGAIALALLGKYSKILTLSDAIDKWVKGIVDMMEVNIVLVFAWALGGMLGALGLKYFMADVIVKTGFPPQLVPAVIFILGGFTAFATGSSFGTWAIMLPIAFPVAYQFGIPIELAVGATISGGLFGDHCSPVSDTTILASTASASDHMEHVRTQLPYGIIVGVASVIGFVIAGFTKMLLPGLVISFLLTVAALIVFYRITKAKSKNEIEAMRAPLEA